MPSCIEQLFEHKLSCNFSMAVFSLTVQDEESTIEEQEALEVTADQRAELADLAKDGQHDIPFSHQNQ